MVEKWFEVAVVTVAPKLNSGFVRMGVCWARKRNEGWTVFNGRLAIRDLTTQEMIAHVKTQRTVHGDPIYVCDQKQKELNDKYWQVLCM